MTPDGSRRSLKTFIWSCPLPLVQSLILVWPQITGLVAATILVFAAAYMVFQRQEIRA